MICVWWSKIFAAVVQFSEAKLKKFILATVVALFGGNASAATLGFNNLVDAWIDSDEPYKSSATIIEAGYTIRGTAGTGCNLDGRFYSAGTLQLQDVQGCMSSFSGAIISASGRPFSVFNLEIAGGFPNAIRYDLFGPFVDDPMGNYYPFFESGVFGGEIINRDGFRLGARVVGYSATKADGSVLRGSLLTPFGAPDQKHELVAPEAFHDIVELGLYYRRTFNALEVMCEPTNINSGVFSLNLTNALSEACIAGRSEMILSDGSYFNIGIYDYRTGAVVLDNFTVSPVPLPASALLMLGALAGLVGMGRQKRNRPMLRFI